MVNRVSSKILRTEEITKAVCGLPKKDSKESQLLDIEVAITIVTIIAKVCSVANYVKGHRTQVKGSIVAGAEVELLIPILKTT